MPYVDLYSKDDFVSICYVTNSAFGNVSGFNPEKPTVLILHPLFLDTQWLENHWGDPRFYDGCNLIAFDMRCSGRSVCRPSGRHDTWVEAADIALCLLKLRLPPCHILALESISTCCALRFAVLFPEMCLSLALCNVPSPTEPRSTLQVLDETMRRWCFAQDMETFEHAGLEAVNMLVGHECDPDLQDDLIAYWATKTPPSQRLRVAEPVGLYLNRTPLEPEVLALIRQPVLIIHGERNDMHSPENAEILKDLLTGVEGGAIVFTIVGAASTLSLDRNAASTLNKVYLRFLAERVPRVRSEIQSPPVLVEERMQKALTQLAEITGRPEMANNDPLSSISFSCLSDEAVQRQTDLLKSYLSKKTSFSPLGPDGKPLRKYSDRKGRHWFESGRDGLSVADPAFVSSYKAGIEKAKLLRTEASQGNDMHIELPSQSTISNELLKTSLAKVVANPANALERVIVTSPPTRRVSTSIIPISHTDL
ncbi:alpha/beta-hydrolase [Macrolepiota fuliginosa MF-IS2]|uniref:Alpha/beta-hydrolase n=1 Tax=Macrolepiota fuliginosa MF-IS2 TaxID=1400762 RepID=A0A9P5XMS8_9AGAR|nr:alpha/beta-hydrolase [Macrolepiota fuliginosa MF-IS2]